MDTLWRKTFSNTVIRLKIGIKTVKIAIKWISVHLFFQWSCQNNSIISTSKTVHFQCPKTKNQQHVFQCSINLGFLLYLHLKLHLLEQTRATWKGSISVLVISWMSVNVFLRLYGRSRSWCWTRICWNKLLQRPNPKRELMMIMRILMKDLLLKMIKSYLRLKRKFKRLLKR